MHSDPLPSETLLLDRLSAANETTRYQQLDELRGAAAVPSDAVIARIRELQTDESRPVRQLARELLERYRPEELTPALAEPELQAVTWPATPLLALCAFGSALTGVLGTTMSVLTFYVMGKFPFPDPVDALAVFNLLFTVPHLVIGLLLMFPGRVQKQLAELGAWVSILLAVAAILGALPAFEQYWAFQMTRADQQTFRHFLQPSQLIAAFSPVLAGQTLMLYFLNGLSARRAKAPTKPVDTTDAGD